MKPSAPRAASRSSIFCPADAVPARSGPARPRHVLCAAKGHERLIITRNGEGYVALIDSDRLDCDHRLQREHIHLLLIDDARRGEEVALRGRKDWPIRSTGSS